MSDDGNQVPDLVENSRVMLLRLVGYFADLLGVEEAEFDDMSLEDIDLVSEGILQQYRERACTSIAVDKLFSPFPRPFRLLELGSNQDEQQRAEQWFFFDSIGSYLRDVFANQQSLLGDAEGSIDHSQDEGSTNNTLCMHILQLCNKYKMKYEQTNSKLQQLSYTHTQQQMSSQRQSQELESNANVYKQKYEQNEKDLRTLRGEMELLNATVKTEKKKREEAQKRMLECEKEMDEWRVVMSKSDSELFKLKNLSKHVYNNNPSNVNTTVGVNNANHTSGVVSNNNSTGNDSLISTDVSELLDKMDTLQLCMDTAIKQEDGVWDRLNKDDISELLGNHGQSLELLDQLRIGEDPHHISHNSNNMNENSNNMNDNSNNMSYNSNNISYNSNNMNYNDNSNSTLLQSHIANPDTTSVLSSYTSIDSTSNTPLIVALSIPSPENTKVQLLQVQESLHTKCVEFDVLKLQMQAQKQKTAHQEANQGDLKQTIDQLVLLRKQDQGKYKMLQQASLDLKKKYDKTSQDLVMVRREMAEFIQNIHSPAAMMKEEKKRSAANNKSLISQMMSHSQLSKK